MKKTAKTLLILALSLVMLFTGMPTFAAEADAVTGAGISPRFSHMGSASFSFSAIESGGHVDVTYEGYGDSFVRAEVTIKLQKRNLLFFWRDLDEWSASSTDLWGDFYHIFELDGKGMYKATMTFKAYGTDGTYDIIEDYIESRYS